MESNSSSLAQDVPGGLSPEELSPNNSNELSPGDSAQDNLKDLVPPDDLSQDVVGDFSPGEQDENSSIPTNSSPRDIEDSSPQIESKKSRFLKHFPLLFQKYPKIFVLSIFISIILIVGAILAYPSTRYFHINPGQTTFDGLAASTTENLARFSGMSCTDFDLKDKTVSSQILIEYPINAREDKALVTGEQLIQLWVYENCGSILTTRYRAINSNIEDPKCEDWNSAYDQVLVVDNDPKPLQTATVDYTNNRIFVIAAVKGNVTIHIIPFTETGFSAVESVVLGTFLPSTKPLQAFLTNDNHYSFAHYSNNKLYWIISLLTDTSSPSIYMRSFSADFPTNITAIGDKLLESLASSWDQFLFPDDDAIWPVILNPIYTVSSSNGWIHEETDINFLVDRFILNLELRETSFTYKYIALKDKNKKEYPKWWFSSDGYHSLKPNVPIILTRPHPYFQDFGNDTLVAIYPDFGCDSNTQSDFPPRIDCIKSSQISYNDRRASPFVFNIKTGVVVDQIDFRFYDSFRPWNTPAVVIRKFPFLYTVVPFSAPTEHYPEEQKQRSNPYFLNYKRYGYIVFGQLFEPFSTNTKIINRYWPFIDNTQESEYTENKLNDNVLLSFDFPSDIGQQTQIGPPQDYHYKVPLFMSYSISCGDIVTVGSSRFIDGVVSANSREALNYNKPVTGTSAGVFLGFIWVFLFLVTLSGIGKIVSLTHYLEKVIVPPMSELWYSISSPKHSANVFPLLLMIFEFIQLSAFSLSPRVVWPSSVSWYSHNIGPIVLFDISAILSQLFPDVNPQVASIIFFSFSTFIIIFGSVLYYWTIFKYKRRGDISINKFFKAFFLVLPVLTTLGFIPLLKATISPFSCTPVSDPYGVVFTSLNIADVNFGSNQCFQGEGFIVSAIVGGLVFAIYLPLAMALQPFWQFLDDYQEIYYNPIAISFFSSAKLLIVLASVFLSRFPVGVLLVQVFCTLFLSIYCLKKRPSNIFSINMWRGSLLFAGTWSGICGIIAQIVNDTENEVTGIIFYLGTLFIFIFTWVAISTNQGKAFLKRQNISFPDKICPDSSSYPIFFLPFLKRDPNKSVAYYIRIQDLVLWNIRAHNVDKSEGLDTSMTHDVKKHYHNSIDLELKPLE